MFPVFVIGIRAQEVSVSVILEMLDMACESYEVCRKEPFGTSIAAISSSRMKVSGRTAKLILHQAAQFSQCAPGGSVKTRHLNDRISMTRKKGDRHGR